VEPSAGRVHESSARNPALPPGSNGVRLNLRERLTPMPARRSLSAVAGSIAPASFAATLNAGQTASDAMTVNLPPAPPKGDVLFLFDLTGSMSGALDNLGSNAVAIMNAVRTDIPDVNFGLVSHEDYSGAFTTSIAAGQSCDYSDSYGAGTDEPYRLDRPITEDAEAVSTAIGAMTIKGGSDGPESYSRALYETYADANIAWRAGAKRVVVSFADNVPHDCNYDFADALAGSQPPTGNDPGRDGIVGSSDDLRIKDVLEGMAAGGITLITIHNGGLNALWNSYAAVTGGMSFQTNSNGTFSTGTPASTIASLITGAARTVNVLKLEVCASHAAFAGWLVSTTPATLTNVRLGQSYDFTAVVGPPAGQDLQNGDRTFDLCAMGDGIEYGRQHVTITSTGSTTYVPANAQSTTTVTVTENGQAVAGILIPAGTFGQAVQVSVRFVPITPAAPCHDYLLAQIGRCLEITARNAAGAAVTNGQPMIAGLCLATAPGSFEIFKFETVTATPIALEKVAAPFLRCEGFQYGSAEPATGLGGLAKHLATRVSAWLTPKPLYAAHGGFGGVIKAGAGLSHFTWASPIQISSAGLAVQVLRSTKDAFALTGTFNLSAKGFEPEPTEAGFIPARDAVTLAFGKQKYSVSGSSFKYSQLLKRWVYAAKTDAGISAMTIDPVSGRVTLAATAPTEGPLPTYRPFSLQIGHRVQGVGLECRVNGLCAPHPLR
jgi:hypothetical protein